MLLRITSDFLSRCAFFVWPLFIEALPVRPKDLLQITFYLSCQQVRIMSFRFYLALFAICVVEIGSSGPVSFFSRGSAPVNFFSQGYCAYSANIVCPTKNPYRTIDGSCNHQYSPYVGRSNTPYFRDMPPGYVKNKYPRVNRTDGKPLPTPREITLGFFKSAAGTPDPLSSSLNNAFAVFARFIEHDLYHTKLLPTTNCCPTTSSSAGRCENIILKKDDPFFQHYRLTCLPKAATVKSPDIRCRQTTTEQVNENTHYLDLSNIYGSTDAKAKELREGKDGLLKVQLNGKDILLPKLDLSNCNTPDKCFLAGDSRVNNDPLLMTMYTLWVRQHNDLAKEIKLINQKYTDEQIFQETRKVVIAIYQHIVYSEFLPILLPGPTWTSATPFYQSHIPDKYISNSFSLAYTALVDTMTNGEFVNKGGNSKLQFSWFNSDTLWAADGIKILVEGMQKDKAGEYDRFVTSALCDQYLQRILGQGTDKVALNLQQSRENGMQSYNIWNLFERTTPAAMTTELTTLYGHLDNVEFLPGILAENPVAPAIAGPAVTLILKKQFEGLRDGDVYFYNRQGTMKSDRLTEIKKMKMSAVMCKYAAISKSNAEAFKIAPSGNDCGTILVATGLVDICLWANATWSEYTDYGCVNGRKMMFRECLFAEESKCKCPGSSFKIEFCPFGLNAQHHPLSLRQNMNDKIRREYSRYFNEQGHLKEGINLNRKQAAELVLRHLFA